MRRLYLRVLLAIIRKFDILTWWLNYRSNWLIGVLMLILCGALIGGCIAEALRTWVIH